MSTIFLVSANGIFLLSAGVGCLDYIGKNLGDKGAFPLFPAKSIIPIKEKMPKGPLFGSPPIKAPVLAPQTNLCWSSDNDFDPPIQRFSDLVLGRYQKPCLAME